MSKYNEGMRCLECGRTIRSSDRSQRVWSQDMLESEARHVECPAAPDPSTDFHTCECGCSAVYANERIYTASEYEEYVREEGARQQRANRYANIPAATANVTAAFQNISYTISEVTNNLTSSTGGIVSSGGWVAPSTPIHSDRWYDSYSRRWRDNHGRYASAPATGLVY